jgi:hypothetical protein
MLANPLNSKKLQITRALCPEVNGLTVDEALTLWWNSTRPNSGLRLTKVGFEAFTQKEIKHYLINIQQDPKYIRNKPSLLMNLDRHLDCPYWIPVRKQAIYLFGEESATMLSLYNGDLEQYMDNSSSWY